MNVIFFGVSGNCGEYCATRLLKDGHYVFGVSRGKTKIKHKNYIHFQGDIRDDYLFKKLPKNEIDLIINFAGVQPSILLYSEKTNFEKTINEYIDINIKGVTNILNFVKNNNVKNYIYSTTHREYENHWKNNIYLDNSLPTSINLEGDHVMYAISKYSARLIGDYFGTLFNFRVFNLRLPMMFLTPNDPYYLKNGKKELMPFLKIIKSAMEGKTLEIWGDQNMKRDYVHVENLYNLIILCLKSNLAKGTFNVGTGEAVTTEKFIKTIAEIFAPNFKQIKYSYKPQKLSYKCAIYNVDEQKEILGYRPIYLKEMLIRIKSDIEKKANYFIN